MKASHRIAELEKRLKRNDDALLTPEERREANIRDEPSARDQTVPVSSGWGAIGL